MRTPVLALALAALGPAAPSPAESPVATARRAADWQLAHPASVNPTDWIQGAFYSGLCALDRASASRRYREALLAIAQRNDWKLGPRLYHADDLCVGQAYLYLSGRLHDPRMMAAVKERCDAILAHPPSSDLTFKGPHKTDGWSWCDSLFMAPPAWVELSRLTGDPRYRDYAIVQWWHTSDFLFDPAERLYFRDSTYFHRREPNGRKVFWSRGNGWVLAGLAHVLEALPANDPSRGRLVARFQAMAERVRGLQPANGLWAASLLDPESCKPDREVSGTGFFCFAFAWGVNHGLLDRGRFEPAARRAWSGLRTCVEADGRLTHVQPVGAAPTDFPADSTEPYGVGAVLLAAAEISRL